MPQLLQPFGLVSAWPGDDPTNSTALHFGAWGLDLTAQDSTAKPGTDFYLYANGNWLKRTRISNNKSYSNVTGLTDAVQAALRRHEGMKGQTGQVCPPPVAAKPAPEKPVAVAKPEPEEKPVVHHERKEKPVVRHEEPPPKRVVAKPAPPPAPKRVAAPAPRVQPRQLSGGGGGGGGGGHGGGMVGVGF